MKKVKKMESLKGYALSAQATSKLDGGYLNTGGGSKADGKTWNSDAVYSTAMGDDKDYVIYEWAGFNFSDNDAEKFNYEGSGSITSIEPGVVGILAENAQLKPYFEGYTNSSFQVSAI